MPLAATNTAAASGGSVSFYTCPSSSIIGAGDKTIHTFTASGVYYSSNIGTRTCEYVVIGGGGSGYTGGGGAGGVRHGTRPIGNATIAVTIGAGAVGRSSQTIE